MRRASLERRRTLRVWRAHNRIIHENLPTHCPCDKQPGRFRKGQRVAGCPNPRCWLCKRHKRTSEPTIHEYRAAVSHLEWAAELGLARPKVRKPW